MRRFVFLFAALSAFVVGALALTLPAHANVGEAQPYSAGAFAAAQNAGKTIVVNVHADWCPTCRAQAPILKELREDHASEDIVFMQVDFDSDKAFLRRHRVPSQSTVLVFNGDEEVARSIAETDRTRLRGVVGAAL